MKASGIHLIAEFFDCHRQTLNNKEVIEKIFREGIDEAKLHLKRYAAKQFYPQGMTSIAIISESHIALHTYPESRQASLDIFTCSENPWKILTLLERFIRTLEPKNIKIFEIERGSLKPTRLRKIFSAKSKYQTIDIVEYDKFGRMLFLDGDLQIAEKDAYLYNNAIIKPFLKKKLNSVAILGGGDGGVLKEVFKLKPREVIIFEIDPAVIKSSQKFLKNICGEAFQDSRLKIVIGDASKFMHTKKVFDAIVFDLTINPEVHTQEKRGNFFEKILVGARNHLTARGILSMQCGPFEDVKNTIFIKNKLRKYFTGVKVLKTFIPSYGEDWLFASASNSHRNAMKQH